MQRPADGPPQELVDDAEAPRGREQVEHLGDVEVGDVAVKERHGLRDERRVGNVHAQQGEEERLARGAVGGVRRLDAVPLGGRRVAQLVHEQMQRLVVLAQAAVHRGALGEQVCPARR